MRIKRLKYLLLIVLIIVLGLLSRQITFIPLFTGDILWATMMFFIVRLIVMDWEIKTIGIISLAICYMVELSQLYQGEWVNSIRGTLLGRLILGQGFLWSDLIAYAVGIGTAICLEWVIRRKSQIVDSENR